MTSDATDPVVAEASAVGRTEETSPDSESPFLSVPVSSCATLAAFPASTRDQAGECSIGVWTAGRCVWRMPDGRVSFRSEIRGVNPGTKADRTGMARADVIIENGTVV